MIFKTTLTLLLFLFFSVSQAEIVKELVINGNKRVSDETIKIYGEIEVNKNLAEKDTNKILNNLYETNFFENVQIELENNVLKIVVKEYPVINQLILTGEARKSFSNEIKKRIKTKEKQAFIKSFLSDDVELIKKLYSSQGYNFANIETKIRKIDDDNLDLVIDIDRGEQTKISTISFIGDKMFSS
jgi:outer membrane protein insertion porin family